jgi:hypothetical protein
MTNTLLLLAGRERVDFRHLAYTPITTLEELRAAAQLAIQVEFTTIPPYLTALYSITDKTSDAYQALRSVVVEEMFHLNQAANILIGIGGQPVLTGVAVPVYPTYLPSANTSVTPYIGLLQASQAVFRNVFMAIETPAPWTAPPEGSHYQTIGQLYKALQDGICACVERYGEKAVFTQQHGAEQRTDIYLGRFGGKVLRVHNKSHAMAAIKQIVEQGEGATDPTHPLVAQEPFGTYEQYGMRTDGTYGPILGTPYELSHFYKFLKIANAPDFPATLPIISNPQLSSFSNEVALAAAKTFNLGYSVMLRSLEQSFTVRGGGSDVYFQITLPLMHHQLSVLANYLMQTAAFPDGDASVGPNATPTFEYEEGATLEAFSTALVALEALIARGQATSLPLAASFVALPTDSAAPTGSEVIRQVVAGVRDLKQRSDAAGFGL